MGSSPRLIATMQVLSADTPKVVVIETLTGKRTWIPWMPRDTVANFKRRVQDVEGIPFSEQILAFNNTRIEDQCTLESYKIDDRNIIYLTLNLKGGYIRPRGILGGHPNSILTKRDSTNAPRWRVAYEGLNIEGKCDNPFCAAFQQKIIHPFHFESFNLVLEGCILCPACLASVKPLTCGFYNCTWKFEGIRTHDDLSVSSAWKKASGNKYHYLSAGVTCVQWKSLLVVVKPRLISGAANLDDSSEVTMDDVCTICWTTFWFITITTAPCGHKFHRCCFDKWSKWCNSHDSLPSCSVCRKPVQVSTTTG